MAEENLRRFVLTWLQRPFRCLPRPGLNYSGYSSIISMPVSMTTATLFNEAMWQRVWASESKAYVRLITVPILSFFLSFLVSTCLGFFPLSFVFFLLSSEFFYRKVASFCFLLIA
jgi:hypothetical protein